ncbi:homoserine dehydrogenase [Oribacterium sp. P6A1]|uniref:homoserine dehydrogenase n=1 Tax=Oribacterium sp. P6A1 TaxID=1410612 RepID=UPI0005675071|nr:homoserine dehydrogenase [Oribacterium sp. P6A1]
MKVAIMGYGTIGSGVAEVLRVNQDQLQKKVGEPVTLKYVLDIRDSIPEDADKLINDFSIIENDEEIKLVVETMGGIHPAYEFVKSCLEKGKHVVTSNKALVDAFGSKLIGIAKEHHCNFYFEASVGGGIPVIRTIYHNYAGENLTEITGIMNGTTNFILTNMREKGADFDEVLAEAQRLGYAERDPSSDIDGFDTSRKTAILLSMASGNRCRHEDIYTEGIRNISKLDFEYAKELGMTIKLLGSVQQVEDKYFAYVVPMVVPKSDPLFSVDGVFNGIKIVGNCLGTTMLYGMGAGKLPTASAVVSDIIAAVRHQDEFQGIGWSEKMLEIEPMGSNAFTYLLRVEGTCEEIKDDLKEFFLEDSELKPVILNGRTDEFAFITDVMFESDFLDNLKAFEEKTGRRIIHYIRTEKEEN